MWPYLLFIFFKKIYLYIFRLLNHIASLTNNGSGEDLWKFLEKVHSCSVPIPGNSISIPIPSLNSVSYINL